MAIRYVCLRGCLLRGTAQRSQSAESGGDGRRLIPRGNMRPLLRLSTHPSPLTLTKGGSSFISATHVGGSSLTV